MRRRVLAIILVLFGDGALVAQLHQILQPHRLCPVHGDLIDQDEWTTHRKLTDDDQGSQGSQGSDDDDDTGVALANNGLNSSLSSDRAPKIHHDDHCGSQSSRASERADRIFRLEARCPLSRGGASVALSGAVGSKLYLLAPKTSPPSV